MDKVLDKLRKSCDSFSLILLDNKSTMIKFADSKVTVVQRWKTSPVSLLLSRKNKFLTTTFSTIQEMDTNLESLNEKLNLLEPTDMTPIISNNDRTIKVDYSDKELEYYLKEPNKLVEKILDSAEMPLYGTLNLVKIRKRVFTSYGFQGDETRSFNVSYFRSIDKGRSGQWSNVSSIFNESEIIEAVKKSKEYASIDGEAQIEEGKHDIVLSPMVLANLVEIIGLMSSAYSIMSSMSFLAKSKEGDIVATEKFTLWDMAKNDLVGSYNFDDEGTLTYNKPIIEHGVLRTFLFNNSLAKKFNKKSTGNAGWVDPKPWSLQVDGGDVDEGSLTDGNVIFFNNNWYTRLQNYYEGQFSTVGRDAVIAYKNGKPIGRVKRVRISDKLSVIIKNLVELSKTTYKQMWWEVETPTRVPFALIKDVMLTKS